MMNLLSFAKSIILNTLMKEAEPLSNGTKCGDCITLLTSREAAADKCSSSVLGIFYEGAPICDKCAVIRYNAAMIKWSEKGDDR